MFSYLKFSKITLDFLGINKKRFFLQINTVLKSLLNEVVGLKKGCNLIIKRLHHRGFPVNIVFTSFAIIPHRKSISHNLLVRYLPNLVRICKNKYYESKMKLKWSNCSNVFRQVTLWLYPSSDFTPHIT